MIKCFHKFNSRLSGWSRTVDRKNYMIFDSLRYKFSVSDHFDCIFMNRFHMKSRRIYLLLKRKCNGHVGAAPEDIYQRESSFFTRTTKWKRHIDCRHYNADCRHYIIFLETVNRSASHRGWPCKYKCLFGGYGQIKTIIRRATTYPSDALRARRFLIYKPQAWS